MKYRILSVFVLLCLLTGCKIELPSQRNSSAAVSPASSSFSAESASSPERVPTASAQESSSSVSGGSSASSAASQDSVSSRKITSSAAVSPKSTASSRPSSGAASQAPSSAPASAPSAPAKQTVLTFSITCQSILENRNRFDPEQLRAVPQNGIILPQTQVAYTPGESVLDVLKRVAQEKNILLSADSNNALGTAYVSALAGIGEKNFGTQSGWMYIVNDSPPGVGAGGYRLKEGKEYRIEWKYVC